MADTKTKGQWPQATIMFSGLALIVVGILAIGVQLTAEFMVGAPRVVQQQQQIVVSPNQLDASTRFVGLELVVIGALLQIVGYVATLPWKGDSERPIDRLPSREEQA
jgi:hypothetical protein